MVPFDKLRAGYQLTMSGAYNILYLRLF